jgi:hypothetical protein
MTCSNSNLKTCSKFKIPSHIILKTLLNYQNAYESRNITDFADLISVE